jgi:hypothetical protein
MTKETLYMIAEIGYEYNDEVYHRPESGGINPVALYRDRQKADAEAARRTLAYARGADLRYYGYEVEDILRGGRYEKTSRRAFEDLMNKYVPEFDLSNTEGWKGFVDIENAVKQMTDEEVVELLSYTTLNFFEVREVVLED